MFTMSLISTKNTKQQINLILVPLTLRLQEDLVTPLLHTSLHSLHMYWNIRSGIAALQFVQHRGNTEH